VFLVCFVSKVFACMILLYLHILGQVGRWPCFRHVGCFPAFHFFLLCFTKWVGMGHTGDCGVVDSYYYIRELLLIEWKQLTISGTSWCRCISTLRSAVPKHHLRNSH